MAEAQTPIDRYAGFVLRRRWFVVGLAALFMLAMTAGVPRIGVTNDHRILFDEDNPQLAALDALEATFSESKTALIAIAPRDGTVFTRESLGAIEALTEAAWRVPYSTRVDSLTNYNHSEAFEDDLAVEPLVYGASDLTDDDLGRIEQIALDAVEISGRLVSRDGRVAGLAINFALPDEPDAAVVEITDHLDSLLDDSRASHPDIDYYVTGDVVMNRAFADATTSDMENLSPIVLLVILVATIALLRSVLATIAVMLTLIFTVNTAMGFAGWTDTVFSPVNAGVPIIVMTIAVADSIHIVTSALAGLGRGLDRDKAIIESLRSNMHPVCLTSVTTAIAFLSLNASDSPPFHVLGNLVAFGVMCALLFSVTLLPALLSILPLRARRSGEDETEPRPGLFDRFATVVIEQRKLLLWSVTLVTVVLVSGIWRIELTDNWTRYFDERYEFRRDTDFIIANLTGLESLEYSLDSGSEGGITDPDYLRAVDAFAEWCREQPEVSHVQAFPDIMKRLNKNMHGDDPAYYRLPDDASLAAQYLLLYELSLPFGRDLNDRIDIAKSATRMTVATRGDLTAEDQRQLDVRAQGWLDENAPQLSIPATGFSMTFAHLSQRNIDSMLRATIIAMALISFILVWVLKSPRLGVVSLVPNFIPAAMAFGLWGYLVGQVGLAGSVMTAIAFGIVVDDTTHFLTKYQRARREGLAAPEAVRATFVSVGRALWTTTAVLAAGFLVFASSGFEVSSSLGLLVTITIGFALLADFLLLPPLLMAIDRRKS